MIESALPLLLWNIIVAAALAMVVAIVCRLSLVKRRPALRHSLWLLVLVKLVTPPAIPLPVLGDSGGPRSVAERLTLEPALAATDTQHVPPDRGVWDEGAQHSYGPFQLNRLPLDLGKLNLETGFTSTIQVQDPQGQPVPGAVVQSAEIVLPDRQPSSSIRSRCMNPS